MYEYKPTMEDQFDGFPTISKAVEAQDDSQFEKMSFALKRTKSNNVYDVGKQTGDLHFPSTRRRFSYNDKFSYKMNKTNDSIYIVSIPIIPRDFLSIKDDNNLLLDKPDKFIDYLSFNWEIWDLLMTWKFILKWKQFLNCEYKWVTKGIQNVDSIIRLENIIWRLYFKLYSKIQFDLLDTPTTNESNNISVNWSENNELCWLYGPLILFKDQTENKKRQEEHSTGLIKEQDPCQKIKPILKKETIDKTMLNNSLWKLKQLKLIFDINPTPPPGSSDCCCSSTLTSSTSTTSSASTSTSFLSNSSSKSKSKSNMKSLLNLSTPDIPKIRSILKDSHSTMMKPLNDSKHITFNNVVKQCVPISASISPRESFLTIRYVSNTCLNIYSDDNLQQNEEEEFFGLKSNAVSHNMNTTRNYTYKYGYDYNSVYTKDIKEYLKYTPFNEDNGQTQGTQTQPPLPRSTLGIQRRPHKNTSPTSTSKTVSTINTHRCDNQNAPSPLTVTKTRNFITGDIIENVTITPNPQGQGLSPDNNNNNNNNNMFMGFKFENSDYSGAKGRSSSQSPSIVISPPSVTSFSVSSSNSVSSARLYNKLKPISTFQLSSSDDDDSDLEPSCENIIPQTSKNTEQSNDIFFASSQYLE